MNILLKYSLLAAALQVAIRLGVYFTHSQFTSFGVYSGLVALFSFSVPLFLAFRERRQQQGGIISMKEIIKTGFGISIIAGAFIFAFSFLYFRFIDHETLAELIRRTEEYFTSQGKPEEIEPAVKSLNEFYTPFRQAVGNLFGTLITGLIFSFILSTIMGRRKL